MDKENNITFVLGPTNTGKTHFAIERMLSYSSGIIGLPLRLLAREIYDKLVLKAGKLSVALVTGEEQIIPPRAKFYIATVEAMPTDFIVDFIAVDEIQLCNDYERGHIFTEKLLNLRGISETLFLGSGIMEPILKRLFPKSNIIKKTRRSKLTYLGKKNIFSLPKRSAVIAFKTAEVYDIASKIKSKKGGAAVVLGALSPQTRNSQVSMFEEGEVDYIVATDAIGMGLNLNINNISFSSLKKYDGQKFRDLEITEIAQIAGRAGRNEKDGFFGSTLTAPILPREVTESIEKSLFEPTKFLYWRNTNLDFSSINSLIKSLNLKSSDPLLIKTLNIRDENILKHLSTLDKVAPLINNRKNLKLLWEVSKIPDYMKSLEYNYTDLLVKLFLNLVESGKANFNWAKQEIINLQNVEGPIDVLTYRLAKTRFWNFVSNKDQWFYENEELKLLAKNTENILSKALHQRLTDQFVDKKLNILIKEIKDDKELEISTYDNGNIILNNKIIGKIVGIDAKLYDKSLYLKNKRIYDEIQERVHVAVNKYVLSILTDENFKITIEQNYNIFYKKNKLASLYKGNKLFLPKLLISNNDYISPKNYYALYSKIESRLKLLISKSFWNNTSTFEKNNSNINAILFSLFEKNGILEKKNFNFFYNSLTNNDLLFLYNQNIAISKNFIFYKKILDEKGKELRWIISSLFLNKEAPKKIPDKKIFLNSFKFNAFALSALGYVKLGRYIIKLPYLESFYSLFLSKDKYVYIFNFYHTNKFKIPFEALYEILNYFGLRKISGTYTFSYWIKKTNNYSKENKYNKDSPFYILKKLQ